MGLSGDVVSRRGNRCATAEKRAAKARLYKSASYFLSSSRAPVVPFSPLFGWEGSPTKIDYRKRVPLF